MARDSVCKPKSVSTTSTVELFGRRDAKIPRRVQDTLAGLMVSPGWRTCTGKGSRLWTQEAMLIFHSMSKAGRLSITTNVQNAALPAFGLRTLVLEHLFGRSQLPFCLLPFPLRSRYHLNFGYHHVQ
jgi:hypothetical protein